MRNHAQSVADNGRCPQLCDLYYIEARLYKVERISTDRSSGPSAMPSARVEMQCSLYDSTPDSLYRRVRFRWSYKVDHRVRVCYR